MKLHSARIRVLAILLATMLPGASWAIDADHADDVCAPDADPCVIDEPVDVAPNAVLDFGVRAIEVVGRGRFNFGEGGGAVLGGDFRSTSEGVTVNSRYRLPNAQTDSEEVDIVARRACSDETPAYPCVNDGECDLGACLSRYCEASNTVTCTQDSDCSLGACQFRRCNGNPLVRCLSNADCELGSCPAQFSCSDRQNGKHDCTNNADCDLGTCSVGEASIEIAGGLNGRSDSPGDFELTAADSVTVGGVVNLSSTSRDGDGGDLIVTATNGSVTFADQIRLRGGYYSLGGSVDVLAGLDIRFQEKINANGGDFDGGSIILAAGRDISLESSILASSTNGAGYGGGLEFHAGGDIAIGPAPGAKRIKITANGHRGRDNFTGDGGFFEVQAEGSVVVADDVRISATGAEPDGFGGDVIMEAGGDFDMRADVDVSGRGESGAGGLVELIADGSLTVAPEASMDADGGLDQAGLVQLFSGADMSIEGRIVARSKGTGAGGDLLVICDRNLAISGTVLLEGQRGEVEIEACRISLLDTALIDNRGPSVANTLTSRESMRLFPGSVLRAEGDANTLRYRAPEKPPVTEGTIDPAPLLQIGALLDGCPECGNSEIDASETCDDGNVTDGDGCSGMCLIE